MEKLTPIQNSPFCCYIAKTIPLAFDESLSYLECVCALKKYLQDTIIPAVNEDKEAVNQLQEIVLELQDYINNLDIQDEVNIKLDAMATDGTLQSLLMNYADVTKTYDTFEDLVADTTVVDEMKVKTLGYHSINDNGAGTYYISDNSGLSGYKVNSGVSGLYIYLIEDKGLINVKQFGAYGDGTHDDRTAIQNAIDYIDSTAITTQQVVPSNPSWLRYHATSKTLYFPTAKYKIQSTLDFSGSRFYNIEGNNSYIESTSSLPIFEFSGSGGTRSVIKDFVFNEVYDAIVYDCDNIDSSKVSINNCKFIGTKNIAVEYTNRSSMLEFNNCVFSWCYKIFKNNIGDNVVFRDCWFSEYEANENNYTSFIILWGEVKFLNCFFIPNGNYNPDITQSNFNNLAWIQAGDDTTAVSNNPSILLDGCRVSTEPNNKTLINWMVVPNTGDSPSDTYIKILNCYQLSANLGHCIVKLWHLPQQIIFENTELRVEQDTFIKLDSSLDIDTEIATYHSSMSRIRYNLDYSIKDCKTQTKTAWSLIPYQLAPYFRYCDFDVRLPLSNGNNTVKLNLGVLNNAATPDYNRMYLVKAYFCPSNVVQALSCVVGLIMFDVVNATVEDVSSVRVKFTKLAQYSGGTQTTVGNEINITPTFGDGSSNTMPIASGSHPNVFLNLTLDDTVYNHGDNYMTIREL